MKIIYDTDTNEFARMTLQPISTPQLILVDDFTIAIETDVFLHISGKKKYLATRLATVNMISSGANLVATEDTTLIRPAWLNRGGALATTLAFDLKFEPEEDQDMWLLISLHNDTASLVAADKEITSISNLYLPGFNNIFPDGRICTGQAPVPMSGDIASTGMAAWLNKWIEVWGTSPFNRDIRQDFHQLTLKFDPDTLTNVKLGPAWRNVYPRLPNHESNAVETAKVLTEVSKKVRNA